MQIQISWLLQKPTDLDLHCLQRQGISGFSRTRVNTSIGIKWTCSDFSEKCPGRQVVCTSNFDHEVSGLNPSGC